MGMKYCQFEGCSYKHPWKSKITQHVTAVHHLIKDFRCNQCPMSFGRNANLKRHIKIVHLKENEFSCDICKKKFTTKQNKDIHQQQIHKKIEIEEIEIEKIEIEKIEIEEIEIEKIVENTENEEIVENIEIEELVENNEFVTPSPITNPELKNQNENFVAPKSDKSLQPIVWVEKLTKTEIELFKGGKSVQPYVLLRKLKVKKIPLYSRKKCQTTTNSEKKQSKTPITTKNRNTLKFKANISKKNPKKETENSKEKKDFANRYNFDSWANRSPPQSKKKTLESIILNDITDKKTSLPRIKTLKECNIFQHLNLKYYTIPKRNKDLKYHKTKFYMGEP